MGFAIFSRQKSQVRPLSMAFNDHGIGVDKAIMSRGLYVLMLNYKRGHRNL